MFGDDGGFFGDAGGYGNGTAATPKGKPERTSRAQSVLPVTTRQIRNSSESGIILGGNEYNLVTMVGRVIHIEQTSIKITYTLEDDRGTIQAALWTDTAGDGGQGVVENIYCRVYGCIKSQEDQKLIMVFKIMPLKSLNELTSHRMEVAVFAKRIQMAAEKAVSMETSNNVGMSGGDLGNSLVNMAYNKVAMSKVQQQVFQVIKRFPDPGVHVNEINNYLTEKISQAQINKICEDLMNEGHIYSSVDEDHFLCTEA